MAKTWASNPGECDGCHRRIDLGDRFYDVRTIHGPWGKFCPACVMDHARHASNGKEPALGTGLGQRYDKRIVDGQPIWVKTAG